MTKARDTANLTGSGVTLPLLDIDAGTDIGAALVDADLMIVDDGAGGTNRKATMSRLATYMGGKITGGSMVYLASSGAISNAATASFTQFDATKYDHYEFWFQHLIPVTDNVTLKGVTSTDGGSSYSSSNGDYHYGGTNDDTGLTISSAPVGSDTNEFGYSGQFFLYSPHTAAYTYSRAYGSFMHTGGEIYSPGAGQTNSVSSARLAAEDVDAIQFAFSSGNIESGEIVMYGIANGT